MTDETKKSSRHPFLDIIMRLLCVYLAASFFFSGLQHWRDGELLRAGVDFALVVAEIGLVLDWSSKKSKVLRVLMWVALVAVFIFLALSKLLK
jgi:hypothetical protein